MIFSFKIPLVDHRKAYQDLFRLFIRFLQPLSHINDLSLLFTVKAYRIRLAVYLLRLIFSLIFDVSHLSSHAFFPRYHVRVMSRSVITHP